MAAYARQIWFKRVINRWVKDRLRIRGAFAFAEADAAVVAADARHL